MNHKLAEQTHAVDKYLLNELSATERLEFEEHFLDCPACSDELKQNVIVVDNLKQVLLEDRRKSSEERVAATAEPGRGWFTRWFRWLRPATLVPAFAAL